MRLFTCYYCRTIKPEISFYKDKQKPSGYKPRCKECEKLYKNKPLRRTYEKKYREQHPEKRRKILATWYKTNKDKHFKTQQKYRQTNQFKQLHKQDGAIRRARMCNAFIENVNYLDIYIKANKQCEYCEKPLAFSEVEFDHFIPLSKGGLHQQDNIKCACMVCNRSKGAIIPGEEVIAHQMV